MFKVHQTIIKLYLIVTFMFVVCVCDVTKAKLWTQKGTDLYHLTGPELPTKMYLEKKDLKDNTTLVGVGVRSVLEIAECREVNTNNASRLCLTKGCIEAAARIDSYIDYSVNYCEDFYQFACGNWLKRVAIPDNQNSRGASEFMDEQLNIVRRILIEEEDKSADLGCVKKAKDLYRSCMDLDVINSRGYEYLQDFLINEFGGWPLTTECWLENNFDFVETMLKLNMYNIRHIINSEVTIDESNSSRHILKIGQTKLVMSSQYYLEARNDTRLMAYEDLIFQVGELLCLNDPNTARQEVADIVDFEIRLANISVSNSGSNRPMTLAEVHGNYSQAFDWRTYVHSLMSEPKIGVTDITDNEIIINSSPMYYQRLNDLVAATPNRTLVNYLIWSLIFSLLDTQGDDYQNILLNFNEAIYPSYEDPDRQKKCYKLITDNLDLAIDRMFIQNKFDADSKTMVQDMVSGIQNAFNELVDNLSWMSNYTKTVLKEKNARMSSLIGYPDEVDNDTYLEEHYKNFTFNKDRYFENYLVIKSQQFYNQFRRLRKPVVRNNNLKWEHPVTEFSTFYFPEKNQIDFPAVKLQPPFVSKTYPMYLNYGGIGSVIGREASQGFHGTGREYDPNGNLRMWWNMSDMSEFVRRTSCIQQQYGNFLTPELNMNLDGERTMYENIADNGGLHQALRAYRKWVRTQGKEEPLLPGLDFNHNQLFFLNFAQIWCTAMTDENILHRIKSSMHALPRYRVIGPIQNIPEFAGIFKCSVNTRMNPSNKCPVW